jgi:hypothetical protein
MDLQKLYAGSFIDWEAVSASWNKRTVPSRLLLFASRRYLDEQQSGAPDQERLAMLAQAPMPDAIKNAFASPPGPDAPASRRWGEFVDAAIATELEMVSYGERPPLLHELRAGLEQAARESGPSTEKSKWFLARRDSLPGTDLPEDPGYLPI